MSTSEEKIVIGWFLFQCILIPGIKIISQVKDQPQAVVTTKTKSNSTYGFFVRKNNNSGWGQDIPPF